MSIRVSFELSEKDLRHFRRLMQEARRKIKDKNLDEGKIVAAADAVLQRARAGSTSQFVSERLDKLEIMIAMLRDREWQIPAREMARVITALAYFAEEQDLIPDNIPALGFLDDAIVIELVVRELRHEIEAYDDFCRFRTAGHVRSQSARSGEDEDARLARKRRSLHERMRRRATRSRRSRRGSGGPRLTLF